LAWVLLISNAGWVGVLEWGAKTVGSEWGLVPAGLEKTNNFVVRSEDTTYAPVWFACDMNCASSKGGGSQSWLGQRGAYLLIF